MDQQRSTAKSYPKYERIDDDESTFSIEAGAAENGTDHIIERIHKYLLQTLFFSARTTGTANYLRNLSQLVYIPEDHLADVS